MNKIISMVPGPTTVKEEVLLRGCVNYGSADIEDEFFSLYADTVSCLQQIMCTKNDVVIQTGEGMLALWSAMKSCLKKGDKVLSISTGIFGYGIGEMAASIGCDVKIIEFGFDESADDFEKIEKAISEFSPKMITIVQNETPSGTINSIKEIGELKTKYSVPLLYVDAVSAIGGSEVKTDEWSVDLCLGASQKCLSAPASMSFLSVSDKAWEIIEEVGYVGYDALQPFKTAVEDKYFPYTPYWQGIAQLNKACRLLLEEGLENSFIRHSMAADYCRERLQKIGYSLFAVPSARLSATVTSVKVPDNITWESLDRLLRAEGVVVGGNYGSLAGRVFRIGHMGTQADISQVKACLEVLEKVILSIND